MDPLYLTLINTNVLAALTIMYIYWLLGGKNSLEYFFPTNSKLRNQKVKVKPKKWKLLIITILLAGMTWIFVEQIETFFIKNEAIRLEVFSWGNKFTSVFFLLRAVGNFTYLGFTKTFKDSTFAKLDTYLYSPICVVIAVCAYLIPV